MWFWVAKGGAMGDRRDNVDDGREVRVVATVVETPRWWVIIIWSICWWLRVDIAFAIKSLLTTKSLLMKIWHRK